MWLEFARCPSSNYVPRLFKQAGAYKQVGVYKMTTLHYQGLVKERLIQTKGWAFDEAVEAREALRQECAWLREIFIEGFILRLSRKPHSWKYHWPQDQLAREPLGGLAREAG